MTKKQRLAHFYHFGLFSAQFQDRQAILMRYCCLIVKIETTGQEKDEFRNSVFFGHGLDT